MEMVLFIGIQGAGKSSFYQSRFLNTHVRINRDTLKTPHREKLAIEECLAHRRPFVIDNTNVLRETRAKHIQVAKAAGFRVIGYFFEIEKKKAIERNQQREGKARVPIPAIYGTAKRLELPTPDEGFDELYTVTSEDKNEFVVEERRD